MVDFLDMEIIKEEYETTRRHSDIDVIVCRDDFKEFDSIVSSLSFEFLDYFLSKNRYRFAIARFRGNMVAIDKIIDWKSSKEECEISRDLRNSNLRVPCVDKDWCRKHDENLYKTALRAASRTIDFTTVKSIYQRHGLH